MATYLTPGTYRSPRLTDRTDVHAIRTDIAGFVGYAERGPLPLEAAERADISSIAVRLTSWNEFLATFGGFFAYGYLPYAVRGFFENGGTTCYVVRVAATAASDPSRRPSVAAAQLANGLRVWAKSPGNWGNRVRMELGSLNGSPGEFSLRVSHQARDGSASSRQEEFYHRLVLDRASDYFADRVVNARSNLITLQAPAYQGAPETQPQNPIWLQGGRDGLAEVREADFTGGPADFRGFRAIEEIDEIAMLCAPDIVFTQPLPAPRPRPPRPDKCKPDPEPLMPPVPAWEDPTAKPPSLNGGQIYRVYQSVLDQCERLRDRVALLDPPDRLTRQGVVNWREQFASRFGALYYPWLKVPDSFGIEGLTRRVPPSGHVAGLYARTDHLFGVQRPPANLAMEFATDLAEDVSSEQQEELNPRDVNAIRAFPGRGIRVWGARSLAAKGDSAWRYIHTRRLMSMIEESVDESTQWAAFEANNEALRTTLAHSVSVFLEAVWRSGGLKGALPAEAFFVKCDETNNPPEVVEAGQLVCQVGVAVAVPMEFLVFELHRNPGEAVITEQ